MFKRKLPLILWTVVLIWMGVIFYLSSQPATQSAELSRGVTGYIIDLIERVFSNTDIEIEDIHKLVRKNAHLVVYFILGIIVLAAVRKSGVKGIKGVLLALAICILFAIGDEILQTFIPGRSGEVLDVFIDGVGSLLGMGLYGLVKKIKN